MDFLIDGLYTQCLLEVWHEGMLVNDGDSFGRPVRRLQVRKGSGISIILLDRGHGSYPTQITDRVLGINSSAPTRSPKPNPSKSKPTRGGLRWCSNLTLLE